MGLNFRYKRTRCTGKYKDRPLVEVRWTTEEGAYSLEDLIAGDLGAAKPVLPAPPGAPPLPGETTLPARADAVDTPHTVLYSGPAPQNAVAIRRASIRVHPVPDDTGEEPPALLDKRV